MHDWYLPKFYMRAPTQLLLLPMQSHLLALQAFVSLFQLLTLDQWYKVYVMLLDNSSAGKNSEAMHDRYSPTFSMRA